MNYIVTEPTPPTHSSPQNGVVRPSPDRWRAAWILALLLAGAGLFFLFKTKDGDSSRRAHSATAASPPTPVATVIAEQADLPIHLSALGTVTPLSTVTIRTRVDGQLVVVHFQEGQLIEAGTPLVEIDPKPLQAQKSQAEAQLARDDALVENAKLDLQRFRALWAQDSVAKEQVDTQEAVVRQDEQQVKLDQALVDSASLQLGYTQITAPISGRIGLRLVDAGNMVHASDSSGLGVITQLQPISVLFSIPQDVLPEVLQRFRAGEAQPVAVYAQDAAHPLAQGKVVTIDNQIDPATGTVKVRAEFPNTDQALFPNQFVNVELLRSELTAATIVPTAAVQQGSQGAFAYVVEQGNRVSLHPLTVGPSERDRVAILHGLEPGDKVVTDGVDKLRDGMTVELVERGSPSPGPSPIADRENAKSSNPPLSSSGGSTTGKPAKRLPAAKDRTSSS